MQMRRVERESAESERRHLATAVCSTLIQKYLRLGISELRCTEYESGAFVTKAGCTFTWGYRRLGFSRRGSSDEIYCVSKRD